MNVRFGAGLPGPFFLTFGFPKFGGHGLTYWLIAFPFLCFSWLAVGFISLLIWLVWALVALIIKQAIAAQQAKAWEKYRQNYAQWERDMAEWRVVRDQLQERARTHAQQTESPNKWSDRR